MKKGQTIVLPVTEFDLKYENVYKLNLPVVPPYHFYQHINSERQLQLIKMFRSPKPKHIIRFRNTSDYPITTAPVLILKDGKIISQAMTTYTPKGAKTDLEMSTAVDIEAKCFSEQTKFTPSAEKFNNSTYSRVDMLSEIEITNYKNKSVNLEVKNTILGIIDEVNPDAHTKKLGHSFEDWFEDDDIPFWWNWYNWPWWWYHVNTMAKAEWEIELKPDQKTELTINWHYFWR